jgi:hypothetical protein
MLEPGTISQDGMTVTIWLEGLSVRFSQPQP